MCICTAVYFPAHAPPFAASARPAEGYFTYANWSKMSTAAEHAHATAPPPLSAIVHFPTVLLPSAASVSPAEGYFMHKNWSEVVPLAYLPSSGVPGLALSPFPTASPGYTFVPFCSAAAGSAYALSNVEVYFWAQIPSGNAHAHMCFYLRHLTW
jgi:hypothetical protein